MLPGSTAVAVPVGGGVRLPVPPPELGRGLGDGSALGRVRPAALVLVGAEVAGACLAGQAALIEPVDGRAPPDLRVWVRDRQDALA